MKLIQMRPVNKPIIVEGAIYYCEATRSNNTLRIQAKIVKEFRELKERKPAYYKMELHRSYSELKRRIKEMQSYNQMPPLLLSFYK